MRIALIGSAESWYARDLARVVPQYDELVVVTFSELASRVASDGTEVVSRRCDRASHELVALHSCDACLVRSMPPGTLEQVVFRMNALGELERRGVSVINRAEVLETAIDKYRALARLREAGLRVPATEVCQTAPQALDAFERLGGDVIIKPLFGSEGRGLIRVDQLELARRATQTISRLGAVLYVQQFIPHAGADLRLLVIGDDVLGMRRTNAGDWRTNVGCGATTEPLDVTQELHALAIRAARAIGATLAGVDILPGDDGRHYVLEVNGVPGWKALAGTLAVDVARMVIHHVARSAQ